MLTYFTDHIETSPMSIRYETIAGISDIFMGTNSFNAAYTKVNRLLDQLLSNEQRMKWIFMEDSKIHRLILNNPTKELEEFVHMVLDPILDKTGKQNLLKTLDVYIRSNCNWTYTKDQLFIHGNTLTYRLNRIQEILNIDLKKYKDILHIQLALEIIDCYPEMKRV